MAKFCAFSAFYAKFPYFQGFVKIMRTDGVKVNAFELIAM